MASEENYKALNTIVNSTESFNINPLEYEQCVETLQKAIYDLEIYKKAFENLTQWYCKQTNVPYCVAINEFINNARQELESEKQNATSNMGN